MIYTQYNNATNLNSLLEGLYPYLTISVDDFFKNYFDITTCKDSGLDNWGAILNFSRSIQIPKLENVFGFGTPSPLDDIQYPQNFANSNFYSGSTEAFNLLDDPYRIALRFRYKYLTCNMSILSANLIMNFYTQSQSIPKRCIVSTTSPMNMDFKFNYTLSPLEITIFDIPNILPVPTGVIKTLSQGIF